MKTGVESFRARTDKKPSDILKKFVTIFAANGWLNTTIRIRHQDKRYRISCTEKEFVVYRINDYCFVSPGFPSWPVCLVTDELVISDSDMSEFTSSEPNVNDWFRFIRDGKLEPI
jgi:hypothetical protein